MRINKSLITYIPSSGAGSGTVTSVAMTVPTGLVVTGSPITSSGTLAISFASGYSIPTTAKQTQWDTAYTWVAAFPSQTGNASKYLKTDGTNLSWAALEIYATAPLVWTAGTFTMSITQASSGADGFLSSTDWSTFNSKLNNPLTTLGDIIYSNASGAALRLAGNTSATQKFLSQTGDGFGNSAAPSWQEISAISIGAVPSSRTLTINGTAYDLSANRTWSVGTVTSVALTTTTSGISISGSPVTTSGNLNIEISTASGSANGLLSSSDWTSFNSRMTNPMTSLGDLIYGNAVGAPLRRAGNITTTKMFLTSTGDGTNAAAPVWEALIPSTIGAVPTTRTLTINGTSYDLSADRSWSVGTVTSVDISVPTGLVVSGNPITSSGTLAIAFASGYSIPTTAKQAEWDAAYNDKINSASVTGTTTKTLTLNQQDGGTITASWTDINTDAVTSVFGRTGAVVAVSGDYTTDQVTESGNLYFTNARARTAISLTTSGASGASTYDNTTGVLNVPTYTASGLGAVPTSRTLTINDVAFDLSADRSWSVGDFGTW